MIRLLVIIIGLLGFSGCVEEFDLDFEEKEPRLVVDALITNQPGPYYVRLTQSRNGHFYNEEFDYYDTAEPVKNATVVISDNHGVTDTLVPSLWENVHYSYEWGYYKLLNENSEGICDTLFLPDIDTFSYQNGYYRTTHINGESGNTYFLKIIADAKEYSASCFMPPVPPVDSIKFEHKMSEKDGDDFYTPIIYFEDPQSVDNFYLFQNTNTLRVFVSFATWDLSLLSDEFLDGYVNGLDVEMGVSPIATDYIWLSQGMQFYFSMSSLTKECYDHFEALIGQFKYDGAVYKPAPASPPTNLSNGALGLFRASSVEELTVIVE